MSGAAIVLLLALAGPLAIGGRAESAGDAPATALSPPRGASAKAYFDAVAARGLQADIVYLPANVPLDAETKPPEEPSNRLERGHSPAVRGAAWVVLALFAALALFLLVRYQHALAEVFGRADRQLVGADAAAAAEPETREIDHDLLARLRSEADPRVGLRLVLQRFLALAAHENRIVLRRSLTTRELLRALPDGWRHRSDLDALARRVELVVFGGRDIDRQAYEECLDLAAPLLFRTQAR